MQSVLRLVLVLLAPMPCLATVSAVTGCHSDRDKDHRPRENCTAAGFSEVPAGFDVTTKVLLFPSNQFSILTWSSFQDFTEIYEVDLTENKIPEVPQSVSPVLLTLCVLRLGGNRLSSLPDSSFSACPGLTELYLQNNAITFLGEHAFAGLSKLEILDLSSNRITVLPLVLLHPLSAIETLYLENNKITVVPDDWFIQKEEVPYLFLSANPWACSCPLSYLHRYLNEYDYNIYVRDGPIIESDRESVVCDSPQWQSGKAVVDLEESDLCSSSTMATEFKHTPTITPTIAATIPPPLPTTHRPPHPPTTTNSSTVAITSVSRVLHTEYYHVVTRSWYHTFTEIMEHLHDSGSELRGDGAQTRAMTIKPHPSETTTGATFTTGKPSTHTLSPTPEFPLPVTFNPSTAITEATTTTAPVPATFERTTAAAVTTTVPPVPVTSAPSGGEQQGSVAAGRGVALFCLWLFAGSVLLCVASGACTALMLARLLLWYRRAYQPIRAKLSSRARDGGGGRTWVNLPLSSWRAEEGQAKGGVYRSVLFISREAGGGRMEGEEEGDSREGGGREAGQAFGSLEPDVRGVEGGGAYRKTLFRVFSREEELEGWREVMKECQVTAAEERMAGEGGGGRGEESASRKRYSVILREEREEAGLDRAELDWVVGGWEVRGGGAGAAGQELRSSWGAWLSHTLLRMPWGVTTPPDDQAANRGGARRATPSLDGSESGGGRSSVSTPSLS